jgi:hypothetical protein
VPPPRIGGDPLRDLAVPHRAGRERHLKIEYVAGEAAVQHPARVGHRLRRLGLAQDLGVGDAPLGAVANMQGHLVQQRADGRALLADGPEVLGLHHGQGLRPHELHEEQVVLHEIAAERG